MVKFPAACCGKKSPELALGYNTIYWIRMTFSNKLAFIERISTLMLASREIDVNYMIPLGLHHIMSVNLH
jgi:alpha-glucuronidase